MRSGRMMRSEEETEGCKEGGWISERSALLAKVAKSRLNCSRRIRKTSRPTLIGLEGELSNSIPGDDSLVFGDGGRGPSIEVAWCDRR